MLQLPCSRAGHIEFPKGRDYRRDWDPIIHKNYKRFAEVWMDDFKKYVYWQYKELPVSTFIIIISEYFRYSSIIT